MAIDGKKLLADLEAARKEDRGRVTLYLSKSVYKTFRSKCGDIPASIVLEQLLREFNNSAPDRPKLKAKK